MASVHKRSQTASVTHCNGFLTDGLPGVTWLLLYGSPQAIQAMRKIETLMNEAITEALNWKQANTEVRTDSDNVSHVYLHGNLIAKVGDTWLSLYDGGYRSNTTKSRLNAILRVHGNGAVVYQKNFAWILSTKDGEEPFVSGTVLE